MLILRKSLKKEHLHLLACPVCGSHFELKVNERLEALPSQLVCVSHGHTYPIRAPRFVGAENYAESFGFQWEKV